jgi:hypothetical protein
LPDSYKDPFSLREDGEDSDSGEGFMLPERSGDQLVIQQKDDAKTKHTRISKKTF